MERGETHICGVISNFGAAFMLTMQSTMSLIHCYFSRCFFVCCGFLLLQYYCTIRCGLQNVRSIQDLFTDSLQPESVPDALCERYSVTYNFFCIPEAVYHHVQWQYQWWHHMQVWQGRTHKQGYHTFCPSKVVVYPSMEDSWQVWNNLMMKTWWKWLFYILFFLGMGYRRSYFM